MKSRSKRRNFLLACELARPQKPRNPETQKGASLSFLLSIQEFQDAVGFSFEVIEFVASTGMVTHLSHETTGQHDSETSHAAWLPKHRWRPRARVEAFRNSHQAYVLSRVESASASCREFAAGTFIRIRS